MMRQHCGDKRTHKYGKKLTVRNHFKRLLFCWWYEVFTKAQSPLMRIGKNPGTVKLMSNVKYVYKINIHTLAKL